MPINLEDALAWESSTADEVAMLDDLQGNILKGHGRDHTQNIFLMFDSEKPDEAKTFISNLTTKIKTAHKQLIEAKSHRDKKENKDGGVFVCFFLSAAGYKALGISDDKIPTNVAFRDGLKQRKDILSDPDIGAWDATFRNEVHGMILIGDDDEMRVEQELSEIKKLMPAAITIAGVEKGLAMKNANGDGIEHFGYVDGRSQPLMLKEDVTREKNENDGTNIWNPQFPLKQVLVPCLGGTPNTSFGSYFVFRKLEQNVAGFKDKEEELAKKLGLSGEDEELAGAMIVGRFEDGTPVVLQKGEGMHHPVPNNFDFVGDLEGNKCPFHAHIRKTNPRGDSVKELGVSLEEERSHIMARRGITYGTRDAETDDQGRIIELKDKPTCGVGLLFMAYQSDFENQFEFTQNLWANNPNFVKSSPPVGIDPVIGQGAAAATPQLQPTTWGSEDKKEIGFHGFVNLKGGEYFFAPSISFLKNI